MNIRSDEEIMASIDELGDQTDRGAGVIGAAIVEEHLTVALKSRLVLTPNIEERIFSIGGRGFASEFSAKIDLAYCVGLIAKSIHEDLRLIAKIRNRFAHHVTPLSFSEETIASLCKTLQTVDEPDPRQRYIITCCYISGRLSGIPPMPNICIKQIEVGPIRAHYPQPPTSPKELS